MAQHSFDSEIAELIGVSGAVIADNIRYWCEHKFANQRDMVDGLPWVYNSITAWTGLLPYFSESQVRTALRKAIEADVVAVRDSIGGGMDRTKWYTYLRGDWGLFCNKCAFDKNDKCICENPVVASAKNRKCIIRNTNKPTHKQGAGARAASGQSGRAKRGDGHVASPPPRTLPEDVLAAIEAITAACANQSDRGEAWKLNHCAIAVSGSELILDSAMMADRLRTPLASALRASGWALAVQGKRSTARSGRSPEPGSCEPQRGDTEPASPSAAQPLTEGSKNAA